MTEKQATWKPTTAAKPPHLTNITTSEARNNTLAAALKGATIAFATSPTSTHGEPSQIKPKSSHASTANYRHTGSYKDDTRDVDEAEYGRRSPSRGRHLSPQHAYTTAAKKIPASQTAPIPTPVLNRASSMIAARLASANTSPVRTPLSKSPRRPLQSNSEDEKLHVLQPRARSNSIRPRPAHSLISSDVDVGNNRGRTQIDFEKIPPLPIKGEASALSRPARRKSKEQLHEPALFVHGPASNAVKTVQSTAITPGPPPRPKPLSSESSNSVKNIPLTSRPTSVKGFLDKSRPPVPVPRKNKIHAPLERTNTGTQVMDAKTRQDTIERMADAMVASSLASRRQISPTKSKLDRAQLSRRRSASVQDTYRIRSRLEELRQPPLKASRPLKTTLRKYSPEGSSDEFEPQKRGRRHLVRKHPHKHHEGDRKRWRDKITDPERRRYEGVFAANRGRLLGDKDTSPSPSRLLDPSSDSNMVVNVIVRDIWERSRLPHQTLREIYDLVAPDNPQKLNREQFVVGLWLIDQKLKGRKLPVKVSEHIWASVRHSQGIKYKPHKPIT